LGGETDDFKGLLGLVASGQALTSKQAERAFDVMMSGEATPSQIGGFLMALRVRGETVPEITGAARSMRARMLTIEAPEGAIDTCGTGGDASGTYNISTACQFVVAGCGVPVAKHGNRALTSKSGAADVLAALGVNIDADMALVERALREAGTCFLMAPRHHGAMRHVGPTRVELGTRTIFNLLGPLSNPARVKRQIVGVFSRDWIEPLARVLKELGHERAWVVHGADGLDELSTTGTSHVAELNGGEVRTFEVTPGDAGLPQARLEDLKGGDAGANAAALRALLGGAAGPFRDVVLFGSAAALIVAGKAADLREGVAAAAEALDSGRAGQVLEQLVAITNEAPPGDAAPGDAAPRDGTPGDAAE
jgi:anthranilate phosphoribosyltransferase